MLRTLAALSVFAVTLSAQRSVPPQFMYHRVYAVVPLVGSGTPDDPKRPMLVPPDPRLGDPEPQPSERPELMGWQMQISDDGKFALVEFTFQSPLAYQSFLAKAATQPDSQAKGVALQAVSADGSNLKSLAANTEALKSSLESSVPGMKLFERGKATEAEILSEFRKRKASYTFGGSSVRPQ